MIYNLDIELQRKEAETYFGHLLEKRSKAEIKQVRGKRSGQQNNYLHLILSKFALHFGYTLAEAKEVYKSMSPDIYEYEKQGRTFYRSSADLNSKEMTDSIEKFRNESAREGCYLPEANEEAFLDSIRNEIEQNKRWL